VIEGALRITGDSYPEFNGLNPVYGWKPRPGVEGRHAAEGEGRIRINVAGFRDDDHTLAKPDGVFRIAVLGDSFTEAREVDLHETYWKRLEIALQSCIGETPQVEVINFAVNGYGTAQQYLVLQNEALAYAPDVVLLALFTGNDIWNNSRALDGHGDRPFYVLENDALVLDRSNLEQSTFALRQHWATVKHFFYNRLRSVQLGRRAYKQIRYGGGAGTDDVLGQLNSGLEPGVYLPPTEESWRQAWAVTERLIQAIADDAQTAGADVWLTTLSTPIQVFPDAEVRDSFSQQLGIIDLTYADRRIAAFAQQQNLPIVPMVDGLRATAEARNQNLHGSGRFAGGHWNNHGHTAAAALLAEPMCAAYAPGGLSESKPLP